MSIDVHADASTIADDAGNARVEERAARIGNGLAIRSDGVLVPSTPDILKLPDIRPYHGDPNWTLEQRLDWLAGRTVRGTESWKQQAGEPAPRKPPIFQELKAEQIRNRIEESIKKRA